MNVYNWMHDMDVEWLIHQVEMSILYNTAHFYLKKQTKKKTKKPPHK